MLDIIARQLKHETRNKTHTHTHIHTYTHARHPHPGTGNTPGGDNIKQCPPSYISHFLVKITSTSSSRVLKDTPLDFSTFPQSR